MTSLRALTPLAPAEAAAPLRALLAAMLAAEADGALGAEAARGAEGARSKRDDVAVVRRYQLGGSGVIRDRRTGRSTGRVDRVLGGELELVT